MLHDLACNQFRFTPPILLQMGVFLYPSADDISYSTKERAGRISASCSLLTSYFLHFQLQLIILPEKILQYHKDIVAVAFRNFNVQRHDRIMERFPQQAPA